MSANNDNDKDNNLPQTTFSNGAGAGTVTAARAVNVPVIHRLNEGLSCLDCGPDGVGATYEVLFTGTVCPCCGAHVVSAAGGGAYGGAVYGGAYGEWREMTGTDMLAHLVTGGVYGRR